MPSTAPHVASADVGPTARAYNAESSDESSNSGSNYTGMSTRPASPLASLSLSQSVITSVPLSVLYHQRISTTPLSPVLDEQNIKRRTDADEAKYVHIALQVIVFYSVILNY